MTNVVAVLVTYNPNENLLGNVFSSISNQVKLLVIDNGSKNLNSIELIATQYKNIQFFPLNKNIGLAAAQNFGISIAKTNKASHVLFFDQDSVIELGFVENLLSTESSLLKSGAKVAAVGPSFYDPENGISYPATVYWGPFIKRVELTNEPIKASFIIASGCLIRLAIIDDIGLMRDELFIDYIDVEWSLRANHLGYSVYMTPLAKMAHTIGDKRISILGRAISIHGPMRRYFMIRNSLFMLKQPYIPFGYKIREVFLNLGRFLIGLTCSDNKITYSKFALKGLLDGFRGKYGAY